MKPGTLLLSQPFLGDPHFERSAVLLCRDEPARGTFGLVLSRPAALTLRDVLALPRGAASPVADLPLYPGGPVGPDTLHYLHRRPDVPAATPLGDGVYWGGDFETLLGLLTSGEAAAADVRLFVGYAGWGAGQLAAERRARRWVTHPASAGKVFTLAPDAFWRAVLREKGGRFKAWANYPADPRLN